MSQPEPRPPLLPWGRAAVLLLVWVILTGGSVKDLPVGLAAAAIAAWVSVRLVPQRLGVPRFIASGRYIAVFLRQSVVAGFDIARRASAPNLALKPGLAHFVPALPPGMERTLFADLSSMAPGTLPVGESADGTLLIHCLDTDTDAAAQMAADEARLAAALGVELHRV